MVGMLIGTGHPSFSDTANTSCSIRASFFQIPIFKLPYQNVIIIRGNFIYCHTYLDTFCALSKMAFVECVLCAFGQMLELALGVVSASGVCLAGGSRGAEQSLVQVGPC